MRKTSSGRQVVPPEGLQVLRRFHGVVAGQRGEEVVAHVGGADIVMHPVEDAVGPVFSCCLFLALLLFSLAVFSCESDTRCAVLQYRIIIARTSEGAKESLRGQPPFRSEACENIV